MSKKKYDNSWWSDKEKEQGYAFRKVRGRLVRFSEDGPENYAKSKYGDKAYSKTDTEKRITIRNKNKAKNVSNNINRLDEKENDKNQSKNASPGDFEKKYTSVEDRYNKDKTFRDTLNKEQQKTEKIYRENIKEFIKDKSKFTEYGIDSEETLYNELVNNYNYLDRKEFNKILKEEYELQNSIYKPQNQTIEFVDSEDRFGKDGKPLDVSLNKYIENGSKLSPEREKLHQDIINSYFDADKYPVEEGKRLYYLTGGGAGTGKSTFVKDTGKYYGTDFDIYTADAKNDIKLFHGNMIKLDADEIKKKLGLDPKDPSSAGYLHGESSALVKRITAIAQERGYNVMLDGTGDGSEAGMLKKIEQAHKNGYKVIANYGTVSQEEGLKRNWLRYTGAVERGESPRLVSGKEVVKTHAMVSRILPNIAKEFDAVKLYDMTNKPPVLIAEGGNGLDLKVKTGYNTKYRQFIDKGNYNWEDYKNYYDKMLDDMKKGKE